MLNNIRDHISDTNIAEHLDEDLQKKIAEKVYEEFQADVDSRSEWESKTEEWVNLATQIVTVKNWPWQGSSNVKYPLVAIASMQFAARAYPSLVPSDGNIVKVKVIGKDPDGQKQERAERIATHMSWQLMYQMKEWEEDMDKLLLNLPIIGCAFKKVYYDPAKGRNCSYLVLAKDLVVNYWAKNLEEARKTHILYMTNNDVEERIRKGLYLDFDMGQAQIEEIGRLHGQTFKNYVGSGDNEPSDDPTVPRTILEQHTWYDLDDDGYLEPYVITIDYTTKKLLRITARFDEQDIEVNAQDEISKITPTEYFTKFSFIPNPDGGFYDVGFGLLLGSLNNTLNTLVNQLIDAGTLNNLQSGYISKGLTLKGGSHMFKPGEWKVVNPQADDLRKGIIPLPTKEPSQVLFALFEKLEESGKQLASVAEIMVGKMPGQNTPATTTMATVQEGMRLFTAVYKRVYRALGKEYQKLFALNSTYLDEEEEFRVLDIPEIQSIGKADYEQGTYDVVPIGDPSAVTAEQKLAKVQALMELIPSGRLNVDEVIKRALIAQEQPNPEALISQEPPPPDPEMMKIQAETQAKEKELALKAQYDQVKLQVEQVKGQMDIQMKQMEMYMKQLEAQVHIQTTQAKAQSDAMIAQQQHEQGLEQQAQSHEQNMAQQQQAGQIKNDQAKQAGDIKNQQTKAKGKVSGGRK